MEIQLKCRNPKCDKIISCEVNQKPVFGFELAQIANDVGWIGIVDMGQHITCVYCSEICLKTGKFTKRVMIITKQKGEGEREEVNNGQPK